MPKKNIPLAMSEPFIDNAIYNFIKQLPKNIKILDIATGQGYISYYLNKKGFKNIYTADINPKQFKLNKKQFHFQKVNANQILPYKNAEFDIIISIETIEHLENPHHFLAEINRILKPKGTFLLTTPNVQSIISRTFFLFTGQLAFHIQRDYDLTGHITILPESSLFRFTGKNGFKLINKTYNCFYLPILKLRFRQKIFLNSFFGWISIMKFKKTSQSLIQE